MQIILILQMLAAFANQTKKGVLVLCRKDLSIVGWTVDLDNGTSQIKIITLNIPKMILKKMVHVHKYAPSLKTIIYCFLCSK
jgi:hypothetical protein